MSHLITQHDYDWDHTNRDLIIFIPNFGRRHMLEHSLRWFSTNISRDRWQILICNDGVHEDLGSLSDFNVSYFTFVRPKVSERNGCFVRNYAIARTKSKYIFQCDPEIIIKGDCVEKLLSIQSDIYRIGQVKLLTDKETSSVIAGIDVLQDLTVRSLRTKDNMYLHCGFGAKVEILRSIRGYDEEFTHWGYEDRELYYRLSRKKLGYNIYIDYDCASYHMWHPNTGGKNAEIKKHKMRRLFQNKVSRKQKCNLNGWGNG